MIEIDSVVVTSEEVRNFLALICNYANQNEVSVSTMHALMRGALASFEAFHKESYLEDKDYLS